MKSTALPRISIVTPSYNQGEFLEECIDSVLSQNYPNLEYVIMDGGSTDNSVQIIRKYEKYLNYWQSQRDNGQYSAISEGFGKTTGDIMCWLNSDDKLHHQAFLKVAHVFLEHPDVEWITGRTNIWDKNGAIELIIHEFLPIYTREKYLKLDYNTPSIQQESTFWKRSLWEKAGGALRSDLHYAGDLELWARFFRHTRVHSVDALLGGFRKHGNQKTTVIEGYDKEAKEVLLEEVRLYERENSPPLPPPPAPIVIDPAKFRDFVNDVFRSQQAPVYSLASNEDQAIRYLIRQLQRIGASTHGTRRYLEHLEIAGSARTEQMSALIAALNKELQQGADRAVLQQLATRMAEQWKGAKEEWDENVALANELKTKLELVTDPEETVKALLVILFRKFGIYSFYERNEPKFSKVYHTLRKLVIRKGP